MIRNIVSVIVGFVTWTVLWLGSNLILRFVMPEAFRDDGSVEGSGILGGFLVLSFVFSAIAGFTTASLAHGDRMKPALALAVIQVIIGIFVQSMYWNVQPLWYHLTFLVLLAPGILLGARMLINRGGT